MREPRANSILLNLFCSAAMASVQLVSARITCHEIVISPLMFSAPDPGVTRESKRLAGMPSFCIALPDVRSFAVRVREEN